MVCEISDAKADRPVTRTCRRPPFHPSVAIARNLSTSRIKRWHSNAPVDCWFVTARKTRIVRSGDVSGCSCSMIVLSVKGFNAGPIRPRGSNESSNSGRGEPAWLLEIAIVKLETSQRRKLAGQNVEDFGIKLQRRSKKCDASNGQQNHAAPHQRASLGYGSGDEITDAHEMPSVL